MIYQYTYTWKYNTEFWSKFNLLQKCNEMSEIYIAKERFNFVARYERKDRRMRRSFLSAQNFVSSIIDRRPINEYDSFPRVVLFRDFYKDSAPGFRFQLIETSSWTGSTDAPAEQWNATFTLTDVSNDPSGKPSEPKARELWLHDAEPMNAIRCTPASLVISYFGYEYEGRSFTRGFRGIISCTVIGR